MWRTIMNETIAQLTLTQIPEMPMRHIKKLLSHFHSAKNICDASERDLQAWRLNATQIKAIKAPNQAWIDTALRWREKENCHLSWNYSGGTHCPE